MLGVSMCNRNGGEWVSEDLQRGGFAWDGFIDDAEVLRRLWIMLVFFYGGSDGECDTERPGAWLTREKCILDV